jgi:DNA-binding MarR family transcriptional regulator
MNEPTAPSTVPPATAPRDALHPGRVDRVLHDPVRMAMVAVLSATPSLSFSEMKRQLGLTDGNLSVHARRLEDVGYITVVKHVRHRATRTEYALAPAGRRALHRYLDALQAFIDAVRAATTSTSA